MANNMFRDTYGKSTKILTENVLSLTAGFKELSKTVVSALENVTSGQPQVGNPDPALGIPKHLPALDPADFKDLPFWYRAPWSEIRNGKVDANTEDPILTLFLEDATGNPVPKREMQAVRYCAQGYFKQLWEAGRAPEKWSDASPNIQIGFIRYLEEEFKFLRYCDRHWKAKQIFMNYYPNWYKNRKNPKNKKTSKRARPSDENQGDGDDDDDDGSSKRPRVEEIESTPPAQPASTAVTTTRKRVRFL